MNAMLKTLACPPLGPALFWNMRVPSGDRLYRSRGMRVSVMLTEDLDVSVTLRGSCITAASGVWNAGSVYWAEHGRLCLTAADMVSASVADVLRLFRGGLLPILWIAERRRDSL